MSTTPALAHGASPGSSGGRMALLIFPVAAILFVFFLVFTRRRKGWTVLVPGGAGAIGRSLVPQLLQHGHRVVVLDPRCTDNEIFKAHQGHEDLREIPGDFANPATLEFALKGCDAVIHLASIRGGSGREPDPAVVKATNLEAFGPLVRAARAAGVKRFLFASSFGLAGAGDKAGCEQLLEEARAPGFVTCSVRAGDARQKTPDIDVDGLVAFYLTLLNQPDTRIDGTIDVPADGWTDAETTVMEQKNPE